ncbi:MAG: glutamyl-tRNA reductase [Proteobacteria bacterium]|nr:glutamyl-tRNA reductase [Pseudomonadota bacterium]
MIAPRTFLVVGVEHKRAPILLRDHLQGDESDSLHLLMRCREMGLDQAMVLATCDRCEVWAAVTDEARAATDITALIAEAAGHEVAEVAPQLHSLSEDAALRYAFGVAASLESQVIGEPQVLGQVKDAYRLATRSGMSGSALDAVVQAALAAAKRVRSETDIAAQSVSMAACVVKVSRQVHGKLDNAGALLIGDGDLGELVADQLTEAGVKRWAVVHPVVMRGREMAARRQAHTFTPAQLGDALVDADIVVAALDSLKYVISAPLVEAALKKRRRRPILLLDLAVPGDIDPAIDKVDDAFRYSFEDLERLAMTGRKERAEAQEAAYALIDQELAQFRRTREERGAADTISTLRAHFEAERAVLLAENPQMDGAELTRRLVARLLHRPTLALKQNQPDTTLDAAARRLFGLDGE